MTVMTKGDDAVPFSFSNWLKPSSLSMFGIPLPGLVVAGFGIVFGFFLMIGHKYAPMVGVGVFDLLVVLTVCIPFGGRPLIIRAADAVQQQRRRVTGESLYVAGSLSTLPADVTERLPGALVDVETVSGTDGLGNEYSLLHHRSVGQLAAVLSCEPDGVALQEQQAINDSVSMFGAWVSSLSVEDGLSGATVVVDSAAASSDAMVQAIRDATDTDAPEFARDVLDAAMDTLPARTASVSVYTSLVYDRGELGADRQDLSPAVAEIASRLPEHMALLASGGAGNVRALTEADLGRVAQIAYRPDRATEIELDRLAGFDADRSFSSAGPNVLDDSNGRLVFHDGVVSMSVMMTTPPQSHITVKSLDRLFGPSPKFLRKRVAVLYRPLDPGNASGTVRRQVRNADWKIKVTRGRATPEDHLNLAMAEQTASELAQGARLSMFSLMVTVTIEPTEKALRDATATVKSIMNGSHMEWRWVEHAGSAAMHTTLPFGILPWKYTSRPLWMEG